MTNWWDRWERDCWRFLDKPDDGFGNCLQPVGSWYHERPSEALAANKLWARTNRTPAKADPNQSGKRIKEIDPWR